VQSLLLEEKVLSATKRMRWKGHGFFSAAGRAPHIPRHLIRRVVAAAAPDMCSPCAYAQIFLLPSGAADHFAHKCRNQALEMQQNAQS